MTNQEIHAPADYSEELRKLLTSDPAHADTFNPLFERLINNDVFLKSLTERLIQEHKHSGAEGEGSKIPIANIEMPVGEGQIVTDQELSRHINERNPHGTRASDVGAATDQALTTHLAEDASTTRKGHVQLTTSTSSPSTTLAPTASALKSVNDSINSQQVNEITAMLVTDLPSDYPRGISAFQLTTTTSQPWRDAVGNVGQTTNYAVVETIKMATYSVQRITFIYTADGTTKGTWQREGNSVSAWRGWKKVIDSNGGDFTGIVKAHPNTSYTVPQVRNIIAGTTDPSPSIGANGDLYVKYRG